MPQTKTQKTIADYSFRPFLWRNPLPMGSENPRPTNGPKTLSSLWPNLRCDVGLQAGVE